MISSEQFDNLIDEIYSRNEAGVKQGLASAAASGAGGAALGTIVPGAGTVSGAGLGALGGGVFGYLYGFAFEDDEVTAEGMLIEAAVSALPLGVAAKSAKKIPGVLKKTESQTPVSSALSKSSASVEEINARRLFEFSESVFKDSPEAYKHHWFFRQDKAVRQMYEQARAKGKTLSLGLDEQATIFGELVTKHKGRLTDVTIKVTDFIDLTQTGALIVHKKGKQGVPTWGISPKFFDKVVVQSNTLDEAGMAAFVDKAQKEGKNPVSILRGAGGDPVKIFSELQMEASTTPNIKAFQKSLEDPFAAGEQAKQRNIARGQSMQRSRGGGGGGGGGGGFTRLTPEQRAQEKFEIEQAYEKLKGGKLKKILGFAKAAAVVGTAGLTGFGTYVLGQWFLVDNFYGSISFAAHGMLKSYESGALTYFETIEALERLQGEIEDPTRDRGFIERISLPMVQSQINSVKEQIAFAKKIIDSHERLGGGPFTPERKALDRLRAEEAYEKLRGESESDTDQQPTKIYQTGRKEDEYVDVRARTERDVFREQHQVPEHVDTTEERLAYFEKKYPREAVRFTRQAEALQRRAEAEAAQNRQAENRNRSQYRREDKAMREAAFFKINEETPFDIKEGQLQTPAIPQSNVPPTQSNLPPEQKQKILEEERRRRRT